MNRFRAWRKEIRSFPADSARDSPLKHTVSIRFGLIMWLVWHGYFVWMMRSRARWHILTDSSHGFQLADGNPRYKGESATVFVSGLVQDDLAAMNREKWAKERGDQIDIVSHRFSVFLEQ